MPQFKSHTCSIQSFKKSLLKGSLFLSAGLSVMALPQIAAAQSAASDDTIIVTGIRASLENALVEKRNADSLKEVILAEDIGKLPDQNLAEVLENITGIQITRSAGVGTGVQIRGTNANRIEINGVSTVGSGSGRSGINFEDVNASIIAGVEVIKASEAQTIEGSVGGTINLRTIRPLDLKKPLISARIQGEQSNLTTEGIQPRFSAALGNKWDTGGGEIGLVVSGSYTKQEAISFRPRADHDNLTTNPDTGEQYLGVQFLVQEQENDDYETINLASTLEWAPNDNLKFYADAIINSQERSRDNYKIEASGVAALNTLNTPDTFETVDFGVGPGEIRSALTGNLEPDLVNIDDDDPNLRFTSETGARITDSQIFSVGGEWQRGNLTSKIQLATTKSDSTTPRLNTTLNFINPNCPLDGAVGDPGTSSDNCVPYTYDFRDNSLAFGLNFDSPFAPDVADLTNPNNVVLARLEAGQTTTNNKEDAIRLDFNYDLSEYGSILTGFDFGYRFNKSSSRFDRATDSQGRFSKLVDTPNGSLFSDLLVAGPNNYGDADGRSLFVSNFLIIDPDRAFNDLEGTLSTLEAARLAHNPNANPLDIESDQNAFFDVSEKTNAFYAQASFEHGIFSGNAGARYVRTAVDSTAFGPASGGTRPLQTTKGSYDFVLPRINLAARPTDDLLIRGSFGSDIRRPNFSDLNTSFTFNTQENSVVRLGNPGLEPEKVDSFDISADWYFAPSAVVSVGYFNKKRVNIFGTDFEGAALIPNGPGLFFRETDPNCPGGGIFNPEVIPGVLGDPSIPNQRGMCVDFVRPGNDPESTTQSGIEIAAQYDLSSFEDKLGWASGFGAIANYTNQSFSGGSIIDSTSGRGFQVLGDVSIPRGLLDFSKNAFNVTAFYEKYGLSARARYTWREAFRTQDFGGGANTSGSSTFSFPVTTLSRGQLNASINYDVTEQFKVGVEATNITKSKIIQKCVAETGPTCFVGYPDRRIVFGGSFTF